MGFRARIDDWGLGHPSHLHVVEDLRARAIMSDCCPAKTCDIRLDKQLTGPPRVRRVVDFQYRTRGSRAGRLTASERPPVCSSIKSRDSSVSNRR